MPIREHIRQIPDFPKPGILFYDISTLLRHAAAWRTTVRLLAETMTPHRPELLIGIESRGFLVAAPLALELDVGFVMVRKRGKLPGPTVAHTYALEYGTDTIEMHEDALARGKRVLIVDDLIATGGTAEAAAKLIRQAGGEIMGGAFIIDLPELGGRKLLESQGVACHVLMAFEGH